MLRSVKDELTFGGASRRELPVSSHLPFSRHVDDWIIKTYSGLLMTCIKLDGFSFQTADWSDINVKMLGRNDIVRTLANSRFALYAHIIRREIQPKIAASFDNDLCREIDERYDAALAKRRMFVNDIYLTIIRRPLQGHAGTFEAAVQALFGNKTKGGESVREQEALMELRDVAAAAMSALVSYRPRQLRVVSREGQWFSEPLEFLVQLGNGAIPRAMHLPRMALNEALAQKRIFFGRNALEFRGGSAADTRFGAMVSLREYPALTGPGFLDNLLTVPHEIVVTQSFALIDRPVAQAHIDRVSRRVDMSDEAGSIVAEHLSEARDELLGGEALYGEHHYTVLALGTTLQEVDATVTAVGAALTDRSVIWIREDLDMEPAFWAQFPGNFSYIARRSIISSKNLAGFVSLHNYPSGTPANNHWGPAVSLFQTASQTAYFFNFHVVDLGNFTLVGPSGSGKTVWLLFIAAQAQRVRPRPKLVFVDKDRGAEIFIRALGGQYEVLEPGTPTGFNPLALPDSGENREFLFRLFSFMLSPRDEGSPTLSAMEEQVIRNAIKTVVSGPREGRSLEAFQSLLQGRLQASEGDLASRLETWIRADQKGWLFNNPEDHFSVTNIFGFDMTRVLDDPVIRTSALMYMFHRIEELLDGAPVMIFLDEGWRLLDDDVFSYFIKDKLKTIRKQNGIVGFGTQSASDIVRSKAANTLIEQTATNIFFPNSKADDESYRQAFRLSEREIRWIRESDASSRSFLIKHAGDSVIAKLDLSSMPDLIKVLSGRTETVAELRALMDRVGDDPRDWLPIFTGRSAS